MSDLWQTLRNGNVPYEPNVTFYCEDVEITLEGMGPDKSLKLRDKVLKKAAYKSNKEAFEKLRSAGLDEAAKNVIAKATAKGLRPFKNKKEIEEYLLRNQKKFKKLTDRKNMTSSNQVDNDYNRNQSVNWAIWGGDYGALFGVLGAIYQNERQKSQSIFDGNGYCVIIKTNSNGDAHAAGEGGVIKQVLIPFTNQKDALKLVNLW